MTIVTPEPSVSQAAIGALQAGAKILHINVAQISQQHIEETLKTLEDILDQPTLTWDIESWTLVGQLVTIDSLIHRHLLRFTPHITTLTAAQVACLVYLKPLVNSTTLSPTCSGLVSQCLRATLSSEDAHVRHTACDLLASIPASGQASRWLDLISDLVRCTTDSNEKVRATACRVVGIYCRDHVDEVRR